MKKISINLDNESVEKIEYIKRWYQLNMPFKTNFTTTDIIKTAINLLKISVDEENIVQNNGL